MTFDQYQKQAHTTAVYPHKDETQTLSYVALGLAGEVGEVANEIKKAIRNDNGVITLERYVKLRDEIGDCLWYLAELCTVLSVGTSLSNVAEENLWKLDQRKRENTLKERNP